MRTAHRTVRAVRRPLDLLPSLILGVFHLRRADVDIPAPQRTGVETCVAETCTVTPDEGREGWDDRLLPYTERELARCQVPAQAESLSSLQPTETVRNARPDWAPVWCPEGCGWFHSAPCYSTHHHDGWQPAPLVRLPANPRRRS